MAEVDLLIPEELTLLARDRDSGERAVSLDYHHGYAAGFLAELAHRDRIELTPAGFSFRPGPSLGVASLDKFSERMAKASQQGVASLSSWLRAQPPAEDEIRDGLVRRGFLRPRVVKRLFVFNETVYPTSDPAPLAQIHRRVAAISSGPGVAPDRAAVALAAILTATGDLARISGPLGQQARSRLAGLIDGDPVASILRTALAATIQEVQKERAANSTGDSCSSSCD